MLLEIPDTIIQEMLDCNLIGYHPVPNSVEHRAGQVQRMQYHFSEYIICLVGKEFSKRKLIPYQKK